MVKLKALLAALALLGGGVADSPLCGAAYAFKACCRVCKAGKPCGDSCISRERECSKPRGCACAG